MMDAIKYTSLNKSNINNYQTDLFGLEANQVFLNPSTFVSHFFNHGILIFAVLFCQVHTLVSLPGASAVQVSTSGLKLRLKILANKILQKKILVLCF